MPVYGRTTQYSATDNSTLLDEHATKQVQATSGTILYYAHVVDPTILPALNKIPNQQTKPTEKALKACRQLGDNLQTNPKAVIQCNTSDMMFSGASYLVLPDDRSRCVRRYTLKDILHPGLPP